jgi:hypothetical protein
MEYSERIKPRMGLNLPVQVQPVDRPVVASALNGDGSINPSFDLGGFLKQAIPIATQVLGGLL